MYSINEFTSDGVTAVYSFTFSGAYPGYIDRDHVKVYYDAVLQDSGAWSWTDDVKITLDPVPAANVVIKIARETPITNALVDYTSGAILNSANLDKCSLQFLYLMQELVDKPISLADDGTLGVFVTSVGDAMAKAHVQNTDSGTTEASFQIDSDNTVNTGPTLENDEGDLLVTTEAEKTLELVTLVWDDLRISPGSFDRPGTSDPAYLGFQPGGSGTSFEVLTFDAEEYVTFAVQLPHGYAEGEDIEVHAHWTPRDRGVAEDAKTVAWKVDYTWANVNGVYGVSATADLTDTCTGVDDAHLVTPSVVISGTAKTISSMLIGKMYRDTGDTWVGTGANAPALLELDFHIPLNTIGSRLQGAK
jgi:hypothetical protein